MIVNGEHFPMAQLKEASLLALIEHFGLDPQTVAVERNGELPDREAWASMTLSEADRVELIRFVGGG